jgi:RNA polymerase sigma-70 factor (ECF subfamily)
MPAPDPDFPLWQKLQQGDDSALDALMDRHRGGLFNFIYRYVLNEQDARDLLQETFVRAYFKRHQFQPRAKVSTWLYRIALNLCRDHARSRSTKEGKLTESLVIRSEEGEERERDIAGKSGNPAEIAQTNEALLGMERAILALPHDLKAAFILAILEARSQQECAELLGITVKAVETRVYRARKILKGKLASYRSPR